MLKYGKKGIGFAVGNEPLPAYFASCGCNVLATDLDPYNEEAKDWIATGQNASGNLKKLNELNICKQQMFDKNVKFKYMDMNHIPKDVCGYDFCWSSCAIEHVGSLEKSKIFLKRMLNVLKPGGIAVHTTEYNLSSDEETIFKGPNILYRKRDLEEMAEWLQNLGHEIVFDFSVGNDEGDLFTDTPPYYEKNPKYHLRLDIGGFHSTSIGIVIRKADVRSKDCLERTINLMEDEIYSSDYRNYVLENELRSCYKEITELKDYIELLKMEVGVDFLEKMKCTYENDKNVIPRGGVLFGPYINVIKGKYMLMVDVSLSDERENTSIKITTDCGKKSICSEILVNGSNAICFELICDSNNVEFVIPNDKLEYIKINRLVLKKYNCCEA